MWPRASGTIAGDRFTPAPRRRGFRRVVRPFEATVFLDYLQTTSGSRRPPACCAAGRRVRAELLRALRAGRADRGRRRPLARRGARRRAGGAARRRPLRVPRTAVRDAAGARRAVRRRRGAVAARGRRAPAGAGRARRGRRGRRRGRRPARAVPAARAPAPAADAGPGRRSRLRLASCASLASLGYERVEQVRERGEFAVRGGLIDVYPSPGDPVRVEFWGDEVESLRTLLRVLAADRGRDRALPGHDLVRGRPDRGRGPGRRVPGARRVGARRSRGDARRGLPARRDARPGARLPVASSTSPASARSAPCAWAVVQPRRDVPRARRLRRRGHDGRARRGLRERLYVPLAEARRAAGRRLHLDVVQRDQRHPVRRLAAAVRPARHRQRGARPAAPGQTTTTASSSSSATRARPSAPPIAWPAGTLLEPHAARGRPGPAAEGDGAPAGRRAARPAARLYFVAAPLREGFVAERPQARRHQRARADPRGAARAALRGRHAAHHVLRRAPGRLRGPRGPRHRPLRRHRDAHRGRRHPRLPAARVPRRRHASSSRTTRSARSAATSAPSGATPSLDKLGGTAWQTVKTRARTAVVEMAGELLQLYAARQAIPGFAFRPTASSCAASRRRSPTRRPTTRPRPSTTVKNDMEAPHPMDRLICGDVGYGKTEVALRAAFKAAEAGKQTLVLVPTTILAEQHCMTFARALRRPAGQGAAWSRASAAAPSSARCWPQFSGGKVDVLDRHAPAAVSTRRACRKDLGLVIVDEEQRFGVRQKELLRQLKLQVDVHEPLGHADPAHAADEPDRHPRHLGDRDAAARPPRDPHLHRRVPRRPRARRHREGARARAARSSTCTTAWRPSTRRRSTCATLVPKARVLVAHGQMARARSSRR